MAKKQMAPVEFTFVDHCEAVLADLSSVLVTRGTSYGDFADNSRVAASIVQGITGVSTAEQLQLVHSLEGDIACVLGNAINQIASKLSRISQTPTHEDSWIDIAGYAILAAAYLRQVR